MSTIITVQGKPFLLSQETIEKRIQWDITLLNLVLHATLFNQKGSCKDYVGKHFNSLIMKIQELSLNLNINKNSHGTWKVEIYDYSFENKSDKDWLDFIGDERRVETLSSSMGQGVGTATLLFWLSYLKEQK